MGIKRAVREAAQQRYGSECHRVAIPDRAFVPIELSDDEAPVYAVLFGRATCELVGNSLNWQGTGGVYVQIWRGTESRPKLLLERQMHGFSVRGGRLIALQHGGYCPDGTGSQACEITYAWRAGDETLGVASQRIVGKPWPKLDFDQAAMSQ